MPAKLDRFLTYIEFDRVHREGLSTFPGLVGFYEAFPLGEHANDSARIFFDYFRPSFEECSVISSLTDLWLAEDFWNGKGKIISQQLVKQKWIVLKKEAEDPTNTFYVTSVDEEHVSLLEELCLLHFQFRAYGYLFLYWESTGLVAYPTKDHGFGFIAQRGTDGFLSAHNFLSSLSGDSRFSVELKTTL